MEVETVVVEAVVVEAVDDANFDLHLILSQLFTAAFI